MHRYDIVFDGGSRGNPGEGYGTFRTRPAGAIWSPPVRLAFGKRVTGNEAEYRTLVAALTTLADDLGDAAGAAVEVFGDSQLVICQMRGEWKVRAANLAPLFAAAERAAARFGAVTFTWQPRARSVELLGH